MTDTDTLAIEYTENRLSHALARITELERENKALIAENETLEDKLSMEMTSSIEYDRMQRQNARLISAIQRAAREAE